MKKEPNPEIWAQDHFEIEYESIEELVKALATDNEAASEAAQIKIDDRVISTRRNASYEIQLSVNPDTWLEGDLYRGRVESVQFFSECSSVPVKLTAEQEEILLVFAQQFSFEE